MKKLYNKEKRTPQAPTTQQIIRLSAPVFLIMELILLIRCQINKKNKKKDEK